MFRRILAENKNKSLQRIAKLEMVCFMFFTFFTPTWGNSWEMIQIWWADVLGGLKVIFHFHPHGIHHQRNHHSVGKKRSKSKFSTPTESMKPFPPMKRLWDRGASRGHCKQSNAGPLGGKKCRAWENSALKKSANIYIETWIYILVIRMFIQPSIFWRKIVS